MKGIVREPGSRAKIAVFSNDDHVDPVGALVGQRGVRVAVVTSELGGEKIDVVEWSRKRRRLRERSPQARAGPRRSNLTKTKTARPCMVAEDQQSLAIGRGGQNVRLAARLTGWKIDIRSLGGKRPRSKQQQRPKRNLLKKRNWTSPEMTTRPKTKARRISTQKYRTATSLMKK